MLPGDERDRFLFDRITSAIAGPDAGRATGYAAGLKSGLDARPCRPSVRECLDSAVPIQRP